MTKIHLRTWMMNTKEAQRECFCSQKRDLSWIQALFLTCFFLFYSPNEALYLLAILQETLLASNSQGHEGGKGKKNKQEKSKYFQVTNSSLVSNFQIVNNPQQNVQHQKIAHKSIVVPHLLLLKCSMLHLWPSVILLQSINIHNIHNILLTF